MTSLQPPKPLAQPGTRIAMDAVVSSQIESIGYDEEKEILVIRFPRGKPSAKYPEGKPPTRYEYLGVSPQLWADFKAAESKGSFFIKNIKPFPDMFPFEQTVDIEPVSIGPGDVS